MSANDAASDRIDPNDPVFQYRPARQRAALRYGDWLRRSQMLPVVCVNVA